MKFLKIFILLIAFTSCDKTEEKLIREANLKTVNQFIVDNPNMKASDAPINNEYLSLDIEVIENVVNKIAKLQPDLAEFEKYCQGFNGSEYLPQNMTGQVDIGFGLTISSDIFYGGYGSFDISIIHFKNKVLYLRIQSSFDSQNQFYIKKHIIDKVTFPIICKNEHSIIFTKRYMENVIDFQKKSKFSILFEENNSNKYSKLEMKMYEQLSDPMNWYSYDCGRRWCGCGYGGPYASRGRIAIDSLSKMKSYELIKKAIFCANPVGRIYAIEKLEKLESENKVHVSDTLKQSINQIKNLNIKIGLCSSCSFESDFDQYTYKEIKIKLDSLKRLMNKGLLPKCEKQDD